MKLYSFTPTKDMTVLELANITKVLFVSLIEGIQGQPTRGVDNLEIDDDIYDTMPDDLKGYFIEKPDVIQGQTIPQGKQSKPGQSDPVDKS